ncbi:hypothetical protein BT63DRAFT_420392 [Microthyrium microscopicum]|uniref:Mitochondrial F1F0 ATP synthase subunit Atp18 n=1 Tax=Microthyrium microscopicum TaxID=703497 RepID=A0A6A6UUS1_9PEZI|nr:hypothetical protein BT63DRAFT_420392 [Microthyrium microscopicum]
MAATGWLGRKWPTPVLKPMWPFYTAGLIVLYGISQGAKAMAQTDEFKNDPRNHLVKPKAEH